MFEFKIIPDDPECEPFEITAGMRDLRLWEKAFPKRSMGMLGDSATMSASIMFELAFIACRRQRKLSDSMSVVRGPDGVELFAEEFEIELVGDDDEGESDSEAAENPTSSAA